MDNTFMGYTIAVGHFNDDSVPGDICTSKSVDIYSYCTYFYLQMQYKRNPGDSAIAEGPRVSGSITLEVK